MKNILPEKTVERLSLCRRVLLNKLSEDTKFIFSHEIAKLLHVTPVQVRRDFMLMGYKGSPIKGYDIKKLIKSIGNTIDTNEGINAAVIGMGNLGNAIERYFKEKRDKITIVASFDTNINKIEGCQSQVKCFHIDDFAKVKEDMNISIAILTVPGEVAADVKDMLVEHGIKGILNYTPTPLKVPDNVYLEEYDITTSLEKVAYFVKH